MATDTSRPHRILAQAAATPDAIAVRCRGAALSYRALHLRASRLAARLRTLGVQEESTVAVLAARSPETVVAILAIHYAGGAYVPLDPQYPREVLAFTLVDCGAGVVIGTVADLEKLPPHQLTTVTPDEADAPDAVLAEIAPCRAESLAYVIYTSGSTGRPKGVLVTHGNLTHSTHARRLAYARPPQRFLLLSSFAFDSSVAGLFWTLGTGGTLVLSTGEERDAAALAALIAAEKITHTLCLPSLYQRLLGVDGELHSLHTVIVAGEACPPTLPVEHAHRLPDTALFNEYGPTEATVWTTFARLTPGAAASITIGQPIAGATVRLLDEKGAPVPDGEPGEIHVGGPGVARGYLNRTDLTTERFIERDGERLYCTGDLARRAASGDLEFLGRLDRQVKLRGYRIELEAIESILHRARGVQAAAVIVREDEPGDPRLTAYVAPASCAIPALRALLAERLPAFMQPSAFVALDALPLMPNGKVDRTALPAPSRERPPLDTMFAPPRDALEAFLAAEWSTALRLDRVGIHDRFFELGGDSLRAATLCAQLGQKLGEPVFVVAIFEAPAIAQLAAYLRRHYAAAVARHFGGAPAPTIERRIDAARLAGVRSLIVRGPRPAPPAPPRNLRAIFILAPPRSGTTLLRAMLARHPALFTGSELRLLGFRTLGERRAAYSSSESVWRHGLIEAIAGARGCDATEAARLLDRYERLDLGTAEFYGLLQQWLGERVLVDKSPSYALDPECLRHAEAHFADAFYIHLARHPFEMIRSFESRHMDRIYLPGAEDLNPREAGEAVWCIAHRNIRDFLATVPADRRFDLRFSDLVKAPREQLERLCTALGLPFDEALLDPYASGSAATSEDDPRFHEHGAIKPEIAEGWRGVLEDNFLSDLTWDLAEELGFPKEQGRPRPESPSSPTRGEGAPTPCDAIAIIGLAGRFPGARTVEAFWENLCAGTESIRPFTDEELRASGLDPAIVQTPGYVNRGAQIDDADQFAASFFGYTPREAELMDPQQRVFLECAWEAFEHAGCDVSRYPGAIGVFAGLALNDYFQFNLAPREELAPLLGTYALTLGNEKDFVATRVAFKLGLRGPAIGVQTACSTSLVALHLACQSLRSGECDAALVGGGRISVPLHAGYEYVDGGIPSPDGKCRAFDAEARGCVPANGIAAVVVKRLADALRDGDRIYSVIRGTAINNDGGHKAGFTAPSVEGQATVIAAAHRAAGVTADTIGYVEAHGTGTSLGDPIEIAGLTRAFRETTDATAYCRIGSVKTNIGHLDTGAGAAGLIKAALALHHGVIPPSLHFTAPNPQIDFARSPFVVNAARTDWPRTATPRRAGVSSFGIGGTNAHAVLEEPPLLERTPPSCEPQLFILSARTRRALEMATTHLARHLRGNPDLNLADVAHTLQTGRRAFEHRRFVVARDIAEAERALRKRDPRRVFGTSVARGGAPLPPAVRDESASDLESLGHRWLGGEEIDWSALHRGERRLRIPLPTYPFERERYWLDPVRVPNGAESRVPEGLQKLEAGGEARNERNHRNRLETKRTPAGVPETRSSLDELRTFLHGMSGVAVEKMTPETTLLELGFDSLFLTQVALALRKQFGVEITFRQLFEELSTIGALAEKVARTSNPRVNADAEGKPAPLSHGPFRPIQKEAAHELTAAQREHLATLTARYTARTAKSKQRTQKDRTHFADPRTVSGFRPYWKELTYPIVVERSAGARMWDADGHEYLDFTMGFGTNLLGHSPAFVNEAIAAQLARGLEIGPQSPLAGDVARMLCEASGLDRAAFTNTGSEAVLAAVRVARTVTGRTRIATFSGYHGINDEFLIKGKTIDGQRRSLPIAPGIPEHIADGVLALDYGTDESLALLRQHAHELAAVLVEPVQSRHPALQPREFLHEVRRITREAGAALVFDEVITGFRCHPGGAQAWFDVRADLVTYGKIIGGGLPMGALCGRREYMDALDGGAWSFGDDSRPEVGVTFFAGTFVRHPLAMAASHAMLTHLRSDGGALQEMLNERTAKLVRELTFFLEESSAPIRCESFASMFLVKFAEGFDFGAVLFFLLREKGIHAWDNRLFFLSTAHTDADLAHFVRIFRQCVEEMAPWCTTASPAVKGAMPSCADGALALTPSQRGLFAIAARSAEASRAYNEASALELHGPLDVACLETALQELIARHEALRTSIAPDGETQTVHPHAAVALPVIDCADDIAVEAQAAAVRAHRFDLSRAPILDARLLRRGPEHHVLLLTLHHIFCNGPSLDALFEEIFALYQGRPLPPAMQLRDFVQRRLRSGTIAAEAFWKMQFAQPVPPLDLPLDRPRPAVKTHAGGRATMEIDAALTSALRKAGAHHSASLFMTLLSAWQVLLHRLSGQDDLVVGVPFEGSDRGEPGGERLIANSTNVTPLRSRLAPDTTFADLLNANRRLVLEASDHQDYFFGDLVAALRLPFDASRAPLFNVLFNYETGRFQRDLDGLTVELVNDRAPWLGLRETAIFELFLNVTEHEGALHCRVDFNRDLFDAATVQRWLGHFRTLLDAVAGDPSQAVERLPLLNALERRQLLVEWNATALEWPREATLPSLFAETANRQPDACAILDHGRRVTYRELDARAETIAAHLRSLGIGRGSFVGVCMTRGSALVAALLGVLKAGAAYVPLDPTYPPERLALMLADSGATIVLSDKATAAMHAAQHPHVRWTQGVGAPSPRRRKKDAAETHTPPQPGDLAYLIYTSGSTGRPKGVALEHRNAVAFIAWARLTFSAEELAGVLAATSVCFDLSVFELFVPLAAGGTIVLAENILELPTLPDAASVTLVNTVPSAIAELIRAWDLPPGVRTVNLAGEPLPEPLVAAVYRRGTVRRVLDLYGPTETTTYSTFTERQPGAPATIGRPIANTTIHILDPQLQPVPIGVAGEIYIGGAGVARGYWAQPELTAERFIANPFADDGSRLYRTGDRAHWRAGGRIVYLGRADRQVKVRGHRIELGEIETALAQLPTTREAAVIAATEAGGEVRLIAYLVASAEAPTAASLRDALKERLPDFMIPSVFVTLDALPRTANGKLDRRALPAANVSSVASEVVEPRDEEERRVAEIWRQVLRIPRVGVHENFFDLGGHSLAAMQVASRLRESAHAEVNFLDVFERPTIAGLAETIRGNRAATEVEEGVL